MASILYTPLRNLERTGFTRTATDISVDASDDSFNSVSTSFAGLLDDQWLYVAGFANAANNGWFQVNGNATGTKILQDTTTALVTEAAGPSVTLIAFYRGPAVYGMDFGLELADKSVKSFKKQHQPIGPGAPETIYYRDEEYINVRTGFIKEANVPQWEEFLASVNGGETFVFDRYGTVASPVEQKSAILDSDEYTLARVAGIYPSSYRLSFKIRVLG